MSKGKLHISKPYVEKGESSVFGECVRLCANILISKAEGGGDV